jgi:ribosomal protein L25 (general stress protein Ctc)
MKDIATFVGEAGKIMAVIYEGEGFWKVNYGTADAPASFSKVFMTESEATQFAAEYTSKGNKPTLLSESHG